MTALLEENIDVHDPVEAHWGTSTILAIFFAASLVSAVFFGLGYSFGGAGTSKRSLSINSAPVSSNAAGSPILPAPSKPADISNRPSPIANVVAKADAHPTGNTPSAPSVVSRPVAATHIAQSIAPMAGKKAMPAPSAQHENAAANEKSSAHIMVQVGAIADRKDAERLVAELRKKGFHAGIYSQKHDKFLHVQIGPFQDAAQAQSKRHQVMASGFHAILKSTS